MRISRRAGCFQPSSDLSRVARCASSRPRSCGRTRSFMCPPDAPNGPAWFTARGAASSRSEPHCFWRRRLPWSGIRFTGGETSTPPRVLPNSLVRIDPDTLEATDVVPVGSAPDLVVAAGGFVWITHHVLRDFGSARVRDAGDRTLKRVDPETGEVETVGGGLAPCGLAPDPSGDVWVANCFASGGRDANVVRVDATTLDFEATYPVPEGETGSRGGLVQRPRLRRWVVCGGWASPPNASPGRSYRSIHGRASSGRFGSRTRGPRWRGPRFPATSGSQTLATAL